MAKKEKKYTTAGKINGFTMRLECFGNPDHGQYAPLADPEVAFGETLIEMRKKFEAYRDDNWLGGGNFGRIWVYKGPNKMGRFSYNGRFWDEEDKEIIID